MARWTLSVDVGTSFTAAAVAADGEPPTVVEFDHSRVMPSLVVMDADGRLLVGRGAASQAAVFPERTERVPKRALVAGESVRMAGRDVSTVALVAAVLAEVAREAAQGRVEERPDRLVLTHPARWGSRELALLGQAATDAGLPQPEFLPEPVAAARHYLQERQVPVGGWVAVFDLGGGTLDTAVLRRTDDGFELAGPPGGNPHLGGEDLDTELRAIVATHARQLDADTWDRLWSAEGRTAERTRTRWREAIRAAKETLSKDPVTTVYEDGFEDGIRITRTEYESRIDAVVRSGVYELLATINRANLTPDQLSAIHLTGGASRTPLVSDLVREVTGVLPTTTPDPKAAVCLGAMPVLEVAPESPATVESRHDVYAPLHPAPAEPALAAESASTDPPQPNGGDQHRDAIQPMQVVDTSTVFRPEPTPDPGMPDTPMAVPETSATDVDDSKQSGDVVDSSAPPRPRPGRSRRGLPRRSMLLGGLATVAVAAVGVPVGLYATRPTPNPYPSRTFVPAGSGSVFSVVYSPDGRLLAGGTGSGEVQLWVVADGSVFGSVSTGQKAVYSVAFSPDGQTLATAGEDRIVQLWQVGSKGEYLTKGLELTGHTDIITAIAFSSRGSLLASTGHDGTVRVWEVATGQPVRTLPGTQTVAFSPHADTVLAPTNDTTASLWNALTGDLVQSFNGHSSEISSVAFHPVSGAPATGDLTSIRLWDVATGRAVTTVTGSGSGIVSSMAFSSNGRTLATIQELGSSVWIRDATTIQSTATLIDSKSLMEVALSSDGRTLAAAADDGVRIWALP